MERTGLPEELLAPNSNYTKLVNANWITHTSEAEWVKEDESIQNVEILDDTFLIPVPKPRDFSPFIIAGGLMQFEALPLYQQNNAIRTKATHELWPSLEQLILHYDRKQWNLFDKQVVNIYNVKAPESIANKTKMLYERLENYGLLFCKDDTLHTLIKQRLNQAESISNTETSKLVNYYKTRNKDIAIESQLHNIRRRYTKVFSALAPLYTTHYWDPAKHQLANFTLAQKRFEELKSLYVDSFETFCRISVIAAGIEGIISTGRAVIPKSRGEFTIEEFDIFKNGSKPDILRRLGQPIIDLFVPYMNHRLRNGIGHNAARYDVVGDQVHYVIENDRGSTSYSIAYISFCESMFNLYIQLEIVSIYVSWVRLFYKPKDGGKSIFMNA